MSALGAAHSNNQELSIAYAVPDVCLWYANVDDGASVYGRRILVRRRAEVKNPVRRRAELKIPLRRYLRDVSDEGIFFISGKPTSRFRHIRLRVENLIPIEQHFVETLSTNTLPPLQRSSIACPELLSCLGSNEQFPPSPSYRAAPSRHDTGRSHCENGHNLETANGHPHNDCQHLNHNAGQETEFANHASHNQSSSVAYDGLHDARGDGSSAKVTEVEASETTDGCTSGLETLTLSVTIPIHPSSGSNDAPGSPCGKSPRSRPASEYRDGLDIHETAFYAILRAYVGHEHGVRGGHTGHAATPFSNEGHQTTIPSRGSDRHQTRRCDDDDQRSNKSEEQGRNPKRRKASQRSDLGDEQFACPFHRFDAVLYATCQERGWDRIESVKKHVLGAKHRTSLHINPDKITSIQQGIPPSKTGPGGRWQAIFQRLFGTTRDVNGIVPSPYLESTKETTALSGYPDLPATADRSLNLTSIENIPPMFSARASINPHASMYVDEARRLTEDYHRRRNDVFMRKERLRTEMQDLDFEAQQLERDLKYNLSNLRSGMEQGLSLDHSRRRTPLVTTAVTEPSIESAFSPDLPIPTEVTSLDPPQTDGDSPIQATNSTLTKVPSSSGNDSGYGTLEHGDRCLYCGGADSSCSNCSKWLNLLEFQ